MRFHSTVNLITNSSSCTFSSADEDSVKNLKKFVNAVLNLAGSNYTADDVLDITLEVDDENAVDENDEECKTYALVIKDKKGKPVPLGSLYHEWTAFC